MKSLITLLSTLFTLLLLNGCTSKDQKPSHEIPIPKDIPFEASAEDLLNKALISQDQSLRAKLQLQAAQKYSENKLVSQASAILKEIKEQHLNPEDKIETLVLNLELGIKEDLEWHLTNAIALYNQFSLERVNIDLLKKLIPLMSEGLKRQNLTIQSAILLIEYSGILDNIDPFELNNEIWVLLRNTDPINLNSYIYQNNDLDVIAWLELTRAIQQNQINLESQYLAFKQWLKKWPSHPASSATPKELLLLSQLPETKPSQFIIALPFSGPVAEAGKAVRDGFIASYIQAQNQLKSSETSITFYDTNKHSIENLYTTNRDEKTLIIGPLIKSNVNKLQNIDLSGPTTLALNYIETNSQPLSPNHENLYQFGLDPEAEITQVSAQLSRKNLNKIAFIAPENEYGFRIHDSLLKALQANQSIIIESVYYNDQKSLSPAVASLLATDLSSQRKNKIQKITNLNLEFEPRRRNDIDAIFMVAKPQIASQLNPLFAYHYARNLPIYSSSQIHQMNEQQNDLEGIYFVEMPWMLNNTIDIKNIIYNAIPTAKTEYSRFYALGADAFTLSPRLKLLKEIQSSQIQGHTGTLSITKDGSIHRELELAVFKKGKAIAIKD